METLGAAAFPDGGEWDCIRRMLSIEEQDQDSPPFVGSIGVQESMFYSTSESGRYSESMFYSLDHADNSNLHYNSQESSDCSGHNVFIANPGGDDTNCYFGYPDNLLAYNSYTSKGFCMMSEQDSCFFVPSLTDTVMEEGVMSFSEDGRSDGSENNSDHGQMEPIVPSHHKQLQLKRKPEEDEINISSSLCGNQKKRPRASRDVQRCMKNARSKKNQKPDRSENEAQETTNAGSDHGHGSSSYTSDQENSNTSASLNSNGKRRASRGSATDPQSLYARKRRERINERLRILQSLVPNGTKVDISTMLEEALHYVKFLQLQIKLLSSDDLWMYAPIAYNGVDIGLDLSNKISPPL